MNKPNFMYQFGYSFKRAKETLGQLSRKICNRSSVRRCPGDRLLVIDISQSMRIVDSKSSRLDVAIAIAKSFIKRLGCDEFQSKITIVVFGKTATVPVNSVHTKNHHLPTLDLFIYSASVMPGTNITAGLETAFDIINKNRNDAHVVLLSDGGHNVSTGPEPIAEKLREYATLECIGIGKNGCVNETLLSSIASYYPDGTKQYMSVTDHPRPSPITPYVPF